ncbi:ABC transporter ATP-binding protein [Spirochaeta thermophila]|uniref:Transporter n=1 Tax=Winmispira thermophila (strain ATCC 49972 / DSM 6192 / RI 19.B1) TaxID=665571 RepID=E0RRR4_WINT6|nr:ABC transporter ATP-binding protein [Spirochaeta thermophila]ADN03168.1 transporter [Spirochaeta thermophila DSM 6192]
MALVELYEVHKDYHLGRTVVHALRGVSLEIAQGEFVALMGPSGCGKTTLLNIVGCIDRPTSGRVLFDGTDVAGLSDDEEARMRREHIGFIFQSFNLIPVLTVAENVEIPLVLKRRPRDERKRRVEELLALVGLSEYASHRPDELSGGQRQRVAIARALVHNPRLVIADEPTANLDSETGKGILEEMRRLNREEGVTFIFSTHDHETMRFAERVVHLKDGRIHDVP